MQVQRFNQRGLSQTRSISPNPNQEFRQVLKVSQQQNMFDPNYSQQPPLLTKVQIKQRMIHKPKVAVVDLSNQILAAKEKENAIVYGTHYKQNKIIPNQYLKTEGSMPSDDQQVLPFQARGNKFKKNVVHKQIDLSGNINRSFSRESIRNVVSPPQIQVNTQLTRQNSLQQRDQISLSNSTSQYISQTKYVQYIAPKTKLNLNIGVCNQSQTNKSSQFNLNNISINASLNNSINLNNSFTMRGNLLPSKPILLGTFSEASTPSNKVLQTIQHQQQPKAHQLTTQQLIQNYYHQPTFFQKQSSYQQNPHILKEIIPIARINSHVRDNSQVSVNTTSSQNQYKTFTTYFNRNDNLSNFINNSQNSINKSYEQINVGSTFYDGQNKTQNHINVMNLIQNRDSFYSQKSQAQPGSLNLSENQNNFELKINQQLNNSTEIRINNIEIKEPNKLPSSDQKNTSKNLAQLCNSQDESDAQLNMINQNLLNSNNQNKGQKEQKNQINESAKKVKEDLQKNSFKDQDDQKEFKLFKKFASNNFQVELNFKQNVFSFAGDSFSNQIQEAEKSLNQKFIMFTQNLFLNKEDLAKMITIELDYKQITSEIINENPQKWLIKYQNSCSYEGNIDQNTKQRQGVGKFIFSNGYQYDGDWQNDKLNGVGTVTSASGRVIYEGQFNDNCIEGKGILYQLMFDQATKINYKNLCSQSKYVTRYEGQFKRNQKEGFGMMYYSSGERFVGLFQNDAANGQGCFYNETEKIAGEWKEGIFIRYKL